MKPELSIHLVFVRRREARPVWRGGFRVIGWFEALGAVVALVLLIAGLSALLG